MQNNIEENNIYNTEKIEEVEEIEEGQVSRYVKRNSEKRDKNTLREYPFENTKTSRWIISILLLLSVFLMDFLQNLVAKEVLMATTIILPILAIIILDKKVIKKLFKLPTLKDIKVVLITLLQLFLAVIIVTVVANELGIAEDFAQNPIGDLITGGNAKILIALMLVQLIFEELIFVIPFLFIYHKISSNKKISLIVGLLISSEIFGAAHLSTYNYNLVQSLVLIGIIRFILSLSYVKTKNLTVSYLVHLIYDLILLALVYAANSVNI